MAPPNADNTAPVLAWLDGACNTSQELSAIGSRPLNGALRDVKRYFAGTWVSPDGLQTFPSPLAMQDLAGTGVNGGTACRSRQRRSSSPTATRPATRRQDAVDAPRPISSATASPSAARPSRSRRPRHQLRRRQPGQHRRRSRRPAAPAPSYFATNETQLSQALSNIVAGAIKPEICDNADNNCNGCTDEGFTHYCNVQPVADAAAPGRTPRPAHARCLDNYTASITPANPKGDLALLPCTTAGAGSAPGDLALLRPGRAVRQRRQQLRRRRRRGHHQVRQPAALPARPRPATARTTTATASSTRRRLPSALLALRRDLRRLRQRLRRHRRRRRAGRCVRPGVAGDLRGHASPARRRQAVAPGGRASRAAASRLQRDGQRRDLRRPRQRLQRIDRRRLAPTSCVPAGTPGRLVYGGTSQCQKGTALRGRTTCVGFVGPSRRGLRRHRQRLRRHRRQRRWRTSGHGRRPDLLPLRHPADRRLTAELGVRARPARSARAASGRMAETCNGEDDDCNGLVDNLVGEGADRRNGLPAAPACRRRHGELRGGSALRRRNRRDLEAAAGGARVALRADAGGARLAAPPVDCRCGSAGGGTADGNTAGGNVRGSTAGGSTAGGNTAGGDRGRRRGRRTARQAWPPAAAAATDSTFGGLALAMMSCSRAVAARSSRRCASARRSRYGLPR